VSIFSKPFSGNGEANMLVGTAANEQSPDWSPAQKFLIYVAVSTDTKGDLSYRERHKDGSLGEPAVFLKTPFNEVAPRFSPDGLFVGYVSNKSGRNEVYVREFPNGANEWQISANGGSAPRWARGGKEIFYAEGRKLVAVGISTRPAFFPSRRCPYLKTVVAIHRSAV
jgi:Tol biopolymer transport system component